MTPLQKFDNLIYAHLICVDDEFTKADVLLLMKTAYNLAIVDAHNSVNKLTIGLDFEKEFYMKPILELEIK